MVSTRPRKKLPFGTITSFAPRSGFVITATTSSPTSEVTVLTVDSSRASTRIPAGTEADCAARSTHKPIGEMTPMCVSELAQVFDDLRDSLPEIPRSHQIENARAKRFHHFFQFVEDIVRIQAETKVVDTAVAIAFDLQRSEVGAAFKQP